MTRFVHLRKTDDLGQGQAEGDVIQESVTAFLDYPLDILRLD